MFFRNNLPIAFLSLSQPRAAWMELEMKFQANQRVNSEQPHVPQQEGQPKPWALVLAPCGVQNPSTALTKAAEPAEQIQKPSLCPSIPSFPVFPGRTDPDTSSVFGVADTEGVKESFQHSLPSLSFVRFIFSALPTHNSSSNSW